MIPTDKGIIKYDVVLLYKKQHIKNLMENNGMVEEEPTEEQLEEIQPKILNISANQS